MKVYSFRVIVQGTVRLTAGSSEDAMEELKNMYSEGGAHEVVALMAEDDIVVEPLDED